jgi:hypothetical protein
MKSADMVHVQIGLSFVVLYAKCVHASLLQLLQLPLCRGQNVMMDNMAAQPLPQQAR